MKILYLTPLFFPDNGGIETLTMNALPRLRERGYQFAILTSQSKRALKPRGEFKGIPIYRYPVIESLLNKNLHAMITSRKEIAALKREFKPDLVHVNFGGLPVSYFHLTTINAYPAPTLLTIHASITNMNVSADSLTGRLLQTANWVTTVSDAMRDDILAKIPEVAPILSRIYNGLPEPSIAPSPLDFNHPTLLCYGRIEPEKGFDLAIEALAQLVSEFPSLNMVIAGGGSARPALKRLTDELGLSDNITFTGWIAHKNIPALINQAVAVIVPSRWREPFGLVAAEAALMARPVIATNTAGLLEIVQNGITGFLFECESSSSLAASIRKLFAHPAQAVKMGKAGKVFVKQNFSMESYINAYDQLYQKIVSMHKRG